MAAPTPAEPIADAAIDAAYDRYLAAPRPGRDAFRAVVRALLTQQHAAPVAVPDPPAPLAVLGYLDPATREVVTEIVLDGVVVQTTRHDYHHLRQYRDLIAAQYTWAPGPRGTSVPAALPAAGEEAACAEEPHYAGEASAADYAATEAPTAGYFRERGAVVHAFRAQHATTLGADTYVAARRWVVTRGDGTVEVYSHEHFAHRFEYVGD